MFSAVSTSGWHGDKGTSSTLVPQSSWLWPKKAFRN